MRTVGAATSREAAAQVSALRPDLLLLEVAPGYHDENLDLVRELRSQPPTRDLPIIALVEGREGHRRAIEAGCDDFLDKVDLDALLEKVRRYLGGQEGGRG